MYPSVWHAVLVTSVTKETMERKNSLLCCQVEFLLLPFKLPKDAFFHHTQIAKTPTMQCSLPGNSLATVRRAMKGELT